MKSRWDTLSLGIVLVGVVLALITFRDYGVTWDEDVHNWYGVFVLDYYVSASATDARCTGVDLYQLRRGVRHGGGGAQPHLARSARTRRGIC